ncbi:MAG: ABC transporter permease [Candidatus Poseidoniales archaeon]|nr:ABC transporter permease [Candidatus Poseidoniales archaeon]
MKGDADEDLRGLTIVNSVSKTITAFPEALSNFWKHKGLIRNFTSRDISQRYRNSIAGYFWTVLEPLLLSAVYYFLFTILRGNTDQRLPLWIILGVITWQYFSKGLNASVNCLTGNKNMIKQIYFPRELFAVSKVMAQLVVTVMSLVVAIPFMIHLGIQPTWQLLFAPIALILVTLQVLGVGWLFAVSNVHHGDIAHLTRFITRAGFFVSPVMWQVSLAIEKAGPKSYYLDYLYILNPMVVPLELMRCAFDGTSLVIPNWAIIWSVLFSILSVYIGLTVFKKTESKVVKRL